MMKKQKNKTRLIIFGIFFLVVCLVIVTGIYLFKHYYNMMDIQREDEVVLEQEPSQETMEEQEQPEASKEENIFANMQISEKIFNIMLIGVDSREDTFDGRSDSMILVHVNPETKKIITTSFLRDMYVNIPGRGGNRLNAAYVYGGTDLLFDTISDNFGIEIEDYVTLNFWLVMDIIDDLGGVDIEITAEEIEYMNQYMAEHNRITNKPEGTDYLSAQDAGMRHLNGNQALSYARIRYIGTDFARASRQRQIISICIDKLKHMDVKEINTLLEKYLPTVQTNLTEQDATTLLFMSLGLGKYTKESYVIPMDETWEYSTINGMSVIEVDCKANGQAWYDIITKE
jgi:LCP family protein required for cell wall assembly